MRRVLLAVLLLMVCSGVSLAQDCTIAAYGDPAGTVSWIGPIESQIFSIYVVLFVENTVAAAAYSMTYPVGPSGLFLQARFTGPSGDGLVIDEPTGTNSALAECVVGFGGHPVLVDEYQFVVFPGFPWGSVTIGPNLSQGPRPVYVTCNDITLGCEPGSDLIITDPPFPTEATSFSAVKSLFNN